jgi:ssRNA-specific RNase YbeY (16S rRNA maturation enzyme)
LHGFDDRKTSDARKMAGRQEKILDLLITKKHKGRPARAAKIT